MSQLLCDVSDVALKNNSNNLLNSRRQTCPRNRYVWGAVVAVLLVVIVVAVAVTLSESEHESSPSKTQKAYLWALLSCTG